MFFHSVPLVVAQMHAPIPLSAAQLAVAPRGSRIELVVRVEVHSRAQVVGEVLDRRAEDTYAKTGVRVRFYDAADTPIVMGSDADIRPGAIVYIDAIVTGDGRADAKRLTVLTQYVHLTR